MNIFKLGAWLSLSSTLAAQAPQTQEIEVTGTNAANVIWDSVNGRSYFLQWSADLVNWNYFPLIEYGDGTPQFSYGFAADGNAIFSRLHYADIPFTGNVKDADFDNDGISNWNEIREGGSKTLPFAYSTAGNNISDFDSDNDGNGLPDGWEIDHSQNVGTLSPYADEDGDGLTNLEESELGTDPNNDNTDGDDQLDGEDAVPKDGEINWKKTPEYSYAWVEIDGAGNKGAPLAVNKNGQVLFSNGLWSSGDWIALPQTGSLSVLLGSANTPATIQDGVSHYSAINDAGVIAGVSNGSSGVVLSAAMYWTPDGLDLASYNTPEYIVRTTSFSAYEEASIQHVGGIGVDGTLHGGFSNILLNAQTAGGSNVSNVVLEDNSTPNLFYTAGPLLDATKALFSERSVDSETGIPKQTVKLYDSGATSDLAIYTNPITNLDLGVYGIATTPVLNDEPSERIWIAEGAQLGRTGKVFLEKKSVVEGQNRWHHPPSMSKGAIRLNQQGEAITKTELWRNGEYHSLASSIKASVDATTVEYVNAHDLASNGIILASAVVDGENQIGGLVPIEYVFGDVTKEGESRTDGTTIEADPIPEVEFTSVIAEIQGNSLELRVKGKVTDQLSQYAHSPSEKLASLFFNIDGKAYHTLTLNGSVEDGVDFDETFTVPSILPRGYILRAETSPNVAGNKGWDQAGIGITNIEAENTFPHPRSQLSLAFEQNTSTSSVDNLKVYFGARDPQVSDATISESGNDTYHFSGLINAEINGENEQLNCSVDTREIAAFAPHTVDVFDAKVSYTVPAIGANVITGQWTETAPNSKVFRAVGYIAGDEKLEVLHILDLPGSQKHEFEPFTIRISAGDSWADSDKVKLLVEGTEYSLKKFIFEGKSFLYPYDPSNPEKPKRFLPSEKPVPQKLVIPNYTAGSDQIEIQLKLGDGIHDMPDLTVLPSISKEEPVLASAALSANGITAAPLQQVAAAQEVGWREPGDTVTWRDLMTAYEWIYGSDPAAMHLLNTYLTEHWIELGDVIGDLDVQWRNRIGADTDVVIQIENDDDDMNPIVCANLLYAGLHKALAYRSVIKLFPLSEPENIQFLIASKKAFGQIAVEQGVAGAELYLSGITIVSEPLDWVLIINDVSDGHYEALAGALPFLSGRMLSQGKHLVIKNEAGKVLETVDADQLAILKMLARERKLIDNGVLMDEAEFGYSIRRALASNGGPIPVPKRRENLARRMKSVSKKPSSDHHAHHDFIWEERVWFARHGIDVNDPAFGRWVPAENHKEWHKGAGGGEFNQFWKDVIKEAKEEDLKLSVDDILDLLEEVRALYPVE